MRRCLPLLATVHRISSTLSSMATHILIHGQQVPVTASCACNLEEVVKSPNFVYWAQQIDPNLLVGNVDIQSVDYFGSGRIGFIKLKATVHLASRPEGKNIPGIVFMRGPSVAILLVLRCNGKKYTVLTRQARVPIGASAFTEIPAGVFDGEIFAGVAAKELKEEVGITIDSAHLVDMTRKVYGDKYPGMFPSPGGCDEYIKLFLYETEVSQEELDSYRNKCTGVLEEGEFISLKVIELEHLVEETSDAKSLCAFTLYHHLSKQM